MTTPPRTNSDLVYALKIAVPLVALVGVVFGVVFVTQNVPTPPEDKGPKNTKGTPTNEPPLRFFSDERKWDPPELSGSYRELPMIAPSAKKTEWASALPNRLFQGVYEQDPGTPRSVQFWFENRNPSSVTLQLKGVSCTSCSRGTLIVIPPQVTKDLQHCSALAALPIGPFNPCGVGLALPLAELKELPRTMIEFKDDPNATYLVPAANNTDGWSPQWGILELGFKVFGNPGSAQKPLDALFAAVVDNTGRDGAPKFRISFDVAHPCEVSRSTIDLGRLDQLSTDKEFGFLVFSSARGPGSEFGDLVVSKKDFAVRGPGGTPDTAGFVEIQKVERVPEAELAEIESNLADVRSRFVRVRTAYKVYVVVRPKVGEHRMEIGAIDRSISVTAGGATHQVRLQGLVRGAVWLDGDRNEIDLAEFKGRDGTKEQADLITEKTGIELALVKSECTPDYYTYELVKQPDRGSQGHYKLLITVPPGKQFGRVRGEAVVEVKGPTPQRIRIPVRSSAGF
jgi:hypothetical protein